jgi:hypothetical protein
LRRKYHSRAFCWSWHFSDAHGCFSLPVNPTGSIFLAPDGFSTSLVLGGSVGFLGLDQS